MNDESLITLNPTENTDRDFVAIVQRVLNNTVRHYRPTGVYVVLIDNWFDHKWLEFNSNKKEVDSSGWRPKLELPCFEPSRVVSQSYFCAGTGGLSYKTSASKPLHILASRRSVGEIISSGVFLWYSHVGEQSDRASLMIYLSEDGKASAWYASFRKNPDWRVGKVKGISKREFSELMAESKAAA